MTKMRHCHKIIHLENVHWIYGREDQQICILIIQLLGGHSWLHQKSKTAELRDAIERMFCHLYIVPCPNKDPKIVEKDMEEVVDLF